MSKFIVLLMTVLSSTLAMAHGDHSRGVMALEDQFARLGHMHLPVEISLDGKAHLKIPFIEEDHHEDEAGHGERFFLHPLLYTGLIINNYYVSNQTQMSPVIELANQDQEYVKISTFKWDLGLGTELETHVSDLLNVGIGVSFVKGKNYYSERILLSKNEKRQKLKLPTTIDKFNHWRIGDKLVFSNRSLLIFNLGVSISVLNISPYYGISGQYVFKYKKIDDKNLRVDITNLKSKSLGLEVSIPLVKTELEKYTSYGKGFSFIIDMTTEEGINAFRSLQMGDLRYAQKLTNMLPFMIANQDMNSEGNTKQWKISVPFLMTWRKMQTNDYTLTEEEHVIEEHKETMYISTLSKDFLKAGLILNNKNDQKTIQSVIIEHNEDDHDHDTDHDHKAEEEGSIYATNLIWSYEKEWANNKELTKKLAVYSKESGIDELVNIKFPEGKLGYTRIDLIINITGDILLKLLHDKTLQNLSNEAEDILAKDFSKYGKKYFCEILSYEKCVQRYKNFISSSISKMKESRNLIAKEALLNNKKKLLNSTTKLVKDLNSSHYLFKAFLKLNETAKKTIHIMGEDIKKTSIQF